MVDKGNRSVEKILEKRPAGCMDRDRKIELETEGNGHRQYTCIKIS